MTWQKDGNGWRRCIGCFQLQISFRKRATHYRALGGKWPIKIRHSMHPRHPVWRSGRWKVVSQINESCDVVYGSVLQCVAICCSVHPPGVPVHRDVMSQLNEWCGDIWELYTRYWVPGVSRYILRTRCMLCVAECCSGLQRVAVWCYVLQWAAVCCSALQRIAVCLSVLQCVAVWKSCCRGLQSASVCCSVLQYESHVPKDDSSPNSDLQHVAVCCSMSQCVAVCSSMNESCPHRWLQSKHSPV